jgi:uncharacterized protein
VTRWAAIAAVALVVLAASPAGAKESFPAFTAPVVDAAKVVPNDVEQRVNAELNDYQQRSGNQIAVAVVKTTGSTSLEDYSIDLARHWGVGQKGKDNGVLVLIAYNDHKLRIEVGRGLEGTLTDLQSGLIIRDRMVPLLKQNDVGAAIEQGTQNIRAVLGDPQVGQLPPPPTTVPSSTSTGSAVGGLIFFVILGVVVLGFFGRRRRGLWALPFFWGGGFGGGGGGGFGGGFGGGGGGGFGGGGASGGW